MDYKIFLQSLSWDEFQTYKTNVKTQSLSVEQKEILKLEDARRSSAFNSYMSF